MEKTILLEQPELDQEWVSLILEALEMGLTEAEIRSFLDDTNTNIH